MTARLTAELGASRVTTGSAALAATPLCRESQSTYFSSMYLHVKLDVYAPYLKNWLEIFLFGSHTCTSLESNKRVVHWESNFFKLTL